MTGLKKIDSKLTISSANKIMTKFSDMEDNDEINGISEIMGVWAAYTGYKITSSELVFLNQFIRNSFPNLNLHDIKQVIFMVGRSELKTEYHGSFSPIYIGQCISEYLPIKADFIRKEKEKTMKEKLMLPSPKPPKEVLVYYAVENFKIAVEEAKKGYYTDKGNILYDLIKKHNLFDPSHQLIEEANEYANLKLKEQSTQNTIRSVIKNASFIKFNKEYESYLLKKSFIVTRWLSGLKNKDIECVIKIIEDDYD